MSRATPAAGLHRGDDALRQAREIDRRPVAQHGGALDRVLELPDVAGPRVGLERGERLRGDGGRRDGSAPSRASGPGARRYAASTATSPARARSGGRRSVSTSRRKSRSWRKRPIATSSSSAREVAATMRTSTSRSASAPSRRTRPSCRTRRSLTCEAGGSSPISSRNSVPPAACSTSPVRSRTASVKAPLRCPKSSDSMSPAGMAPQLTATKGAAARGESACSARATSAANDPRLPTNEHGGKAVAPPSAASLAAPPWRRWRPRASREGRGEPRAGSR